MYVPTSVQPDILRVISRAKELIYLAKSSACCCYCLKFITWGRYQRILFHFAESMKTKLTNEHLHGLSCKYLQKFSPSQHFIFEESFSNHYAVSSMTPSNWMEPITSNRFPKFLQEEEGWKTSPELSSKKLAPMPMAQGWAGKTWSAFSSSRGTKGAAAAAFLSHTEGTREVESANSTVVWNRNSRCFWGRRLHFQSIFSVWLKSPAVALYLTSQALSC